MKRMATIILTILVSTVLSAPPSSSVVIFESPGINPYEALYKAICQVESSGNPNAIGDKNLKNYSYGIAQIRQTRLDDYYQLTGIKYSVYEMFDTTKSRKVFMYYCSLFRPDQIEAISRSWNAGPGWQKVKSSKKYYLKIKAKL